MQNRVPTRPTARLPVLTAGVAPRPLWVWGAPDRPSAVGLRREILRMQDEAGALRHPDHVHLAVGVAVVGEIHHPMVRTVSRPDLPMLAARQDRRQDSAEII